MARDRMGLPMRPFLYTLDQVMTLLAMNDLSQFKMNYLYFEDRHAGVNPLDRMVAHNIAEPGMKPDWRISEPEFIRWLKRKGFRIYELNQMTNDRPLNEGIPSRLRSPKQD